MPHIPTCFALPPGWTFPCAQKFSTGSTGLGCMKSPRVCMRLDVCIWSHTLTATDNTATSITFLNHSIRILDSTRVLADTSSCVVSASSLIFVSFCLVSDIHLCFLNLIYFFGIFFTRLYSPPRSGGKWRYLHSILPFLCTLYSGNGWGHWWIAVNPKSSVSFFIHTWCTNLNT